MAEQVCRVLGKCSASARWDSAGHSKSLSFVERSMATVERSVGLVVYMSYNWLEVRIWVRFYGTHS